MQERQEWEMNDEEQMFDPKYFFFFFLIILFVVLRCKVVFFLFFFLSTGGSRTGYEEQTKNWGLSTNCSILTEVHLTFFLSFSVD